MRVWLPRLSGKLRTIVLVLIALALSAWALVESSHVRPRLTITAPERQILAAFSPDGRILATAARHGDHKTGLVRLWDVISGKELGAFLRDHRSGHSAHPMLLRASIQFSPDGRLLGVCDESMRVIELYEVSTQQPVDVIPFLGDQAYFHFSPDGQILYYSTVEQNRPVLPARDLANRKALFSLPGIDREPCFSPDGKVIVTGNRFSFTLEEILDGLDRQKNQVKVWSSTTGKLLKLIDLGETHPYVLEFSPSGEALLVNSSLYDTSTWLVRTTFEYRPHRGAFSSDGSFIASSEFWCPGSLSDVFSDYRLAVWDTATGQVCARHGIWEAKCVYRGYDPTFIPHSKIALAPVFYNLRSAERNPILQWLDNFVSRETGWENGSALFFYDVTTGQQLPSIKQTGHEIDYLCAPDGKTLGLINDSTPGSGRQIQLYDLPPHRRWWTVLLAVVIPLGAIGLLVGSWWSPNETTPAAQARRDVTATCPPQ